ncbi:MAG: hypothetical protein ACREVY_16720 [Gammaproteobacteria bacterium]
MPGYVVAQFLGAVTGVVAAHGMFDLPLIAVHQGTRRTQSWLERVCRKLWALIFDFDWLTPSSGISPLRSCRVHHGGLLVYRLHLFCESRCNLCAHVDRHLLGVSARWTSRYSCSASLSYGRCNFVVAQIRASAMIELHTAQIWVARPDRPKKDEMANKQSKPGECKSTPTSTNRCFVWLTERTTKTRVFNRILP